ncbi:NAD-dependent epimerase/dehydratase family protein [Tistrella bauzanensis]
MRVFVTGSTGFIGSAIVRELLAAGHSVLGLAPTDRAVATLHALGAEAHSGDITDPASLAAGATGCDGVIHAAFIHDFTAYAAAAEADRLAVTAMTDALAGSNKPVIATSVTVLLPGGRPGCETDALAPEGPLGARGASERAVLRAAETGLRTAAIRIPPRFTAPAITASYRP